MVSPRMFQPVVAVWLLARKQSQLNLRAETCVERWLDALGYLHLRPASTPAFAESVKRESERQMALSSRHDFRDFPPELVAALDALSGEYEIGTPDLFAWRSPSDWMFIEVKDERDILRVDQARWMLRHADLHPVIIWVVGADSPTIQEPIRRGRATPRGRRLPRSTRPSCPRCEAPSERIVKAGSPTGRQRYRCKACQKQFVEQT